MLTLDQKMAALDAFFEDMEDPPLRPEPVVGNEEKAESASQIQTPNDDYYPDIYADDADDFPEPIVAKKAAPKKKKAPHKKTVFNTPFHPVHSEGAMLLPPGGLADTSQLFVPILAARKYPFRYVDKDHCQPVAEAFWDEGKFFERQWKM